MKNQFKKTITLGFTGASGMPYGLRLLECLLASDVQVYLLLSQAAQVVCAMETELKLPGKIDNLERYLREHFSIHDEQLTVFGQQEWLAPIASGSGISEAMVVCPCTSGCIAAIANGASDNLLERAADVTLKEHKKLILVHREMPISVIHLENMLRLARAGALIMPASPGFYHQPESIADLVDFVVARILDHLDVPHHISKRWGS